ncbi:hypothetical protein IEO21_01096 [Rhodonia placenta]|uniref:Uncharacterized protein n=1 Tax=Rhodonia placenta TaxID=104341 RepID=A0A8H7PA72_9APHY|nr:hypothetical protein IEO21_01096 [Postia placenta]
MEHKSRKPLTTYSHRRTRVKNTTSEIPKSSPLQAVPSDTEEITLEEMAHRMKKRSRQTALSDTTLSRSLAVRDSSKPCKKAKLSSLVNSDDTLSSNAAAFSYISTQSLASGQFCTPKPAVCSDQPVLSAADSQERALEPAGFSPLPVAHHLLSRTSSRNLKENSNRGLASPFTSRPNSRAGSPMGLVKSKTKGNGRRPSHQKSRTLSTSRLSPVTRQVQDKATEAKPDDITASTNVLSSSFKSGKQYPVSQATGAVKSNMHIRTGSIPTMAASASDTWLVLPETFGRSAQLDGNSEHASFFTDAPTQVSTPPRMRRATTGAVRMQAGSLEADMSDSSASKGAKLDTDAHMQDASPSRPSVGAFVGRPPPRRRRRTINHPSTDGLFSSVLDFSTSAEDKRPSSALGVPIGQSANQQHMLHAGSALSLSSNFSGLDLGLASAFASISSPPSASSTLYQSPSAPAPKLDHGLGYIHVSESRASSSDPDVHMHDTDGEELRDLFSTMGLDEDEEQKRTASSILANASSVTSHSRLRSDSPKTISQSTRSKEHIHSRKRGDTIRASDSSRLPNLPGGSTTDLNSQANVAVSSTRTARTRSGTVTLANFAASTPASRMVAERTRAEIVLASPLHTHKHKRGGWPAIRTTFNDEPLRIASDEDSDDELLLKAGTRFD